jgi:hypothetical protein
MCEGEGTTSKVTEVWHIHKVGGLTLLIQVDSARQSVGVYQKCP